jgi:hypothetical protein
MIAPHLSGRVMTPVVRKRLRQIEVLYRKEEDGSQDLIFCSRPFVLCGLPLRRPPKGTLLHTRRNGKFILQVQAHPDFGLPFGQDRLIPIWVATLAVRQQSRCVHFRSGSEMLEEFGLPRNGKHYRRLIDGFKSSRARFTSAPMNVSRSVPFGNSRALPSSITCGSGT